MNCFNKPFNEEEHQDGPRLLAHAEQPKTREDLYEETGADNAEISKWIDQGRPKNDDDLQHGRNDLANTSKCMYARTYARVYVGTSRITRLHRDSSCILISISSFYF